MSNHKEYIFYAGSLRPGGGLTVAKTMIESIASIPENKITVFTGAKDASSNLQELFKSFANVEEKTFLQNKSPLLRYFYSKIYFLLFTLFKTKTLLISVNYYIPCWCKIFVYHINLLSFMSSKQNSFGFKIKRFDAMIACKMATINVFESVYLLETAQEFVGYVRNPRHLYIGIDNIFFTQCLGGSWRDNRLPNMLAVTSVQPHKDNKTLVDTVAALVEKEPNIEWKLVVAGGQSKDQWRSLQQYAKTKNVAELVDFLGPVSKSQLADLMQNSLCLLSTSLVESFCMVAIESMAAGCPVVVTGETSMPESVGNAAVIAESKSSDSFSDAVLGFYLNEQVRVNFLKRGSKRAVLFSSDLFKNNLLGLLNEV